MKYRKGSTIRTWDSYTIIPLFNWSDDEKEISQLPQFPSLPEFFSYDNFLARFDERIQRFLRKLSKKTYSSYYRYFVASVVAAFFFLTTNDISSWKGPYFNNQLDLFPMLSLLSNSWMLVNNKISCDGWEHLIAQLLQVIHIVTRDHPLLSYARDIIPHLSVSELEDVATILNLETKCRSSLGLQHIVQQLCSSKAVPTFVIVPSLMCLTNSFIAPILPSINDINHCCLPTAQLELKNDSTISLTAHFDIVSEDDVSILYVTDDTVDERDTILQCRIGQSCLCLRCRYELATNEPIEPKLNMNFTHAELIRIGRYHMIKEDFSKAKLVYREALDTLLVDTGSHSSVPDICHALGAIELSMGNFLKAQNIWKDANRDHPELCSGHDGIVLQLEKMKNYGYFESESSSDWDTPIPNCFVTSILESETCQKIIDWAETLGKWTTKRHYAVPTFDVPIHTVPPLLDWFQNKFMNLIIQPLLTKQFKLSPNRRFFVHDAFCVRYESNAVANHLPIHVDESTHSLVVALNDNFEGGGTYFPDYDITLRPSKGSVISFRGDTLPHGGQAVTGGMRYILAVFLYCEEYHQLGGKESTADKRDRPESNLCLRKTKQQKTDFSFNFAC